jgi:hypothetical protein
VSSWSALDYHGLATESIRAITSVSINATTKHDTKPGLFFYQKIKPELFEGFTLIVEKHEYYIASPSKALFDLLYLKTWQFRGFTVERVRPLIDSLRIDLDDMEPDEQDKFWILIKRHLV